MRWSERQLAMLREMGIRVWARERPGDVAEAGGGIAVAERTAAPAPALPPQARAPAPAYEPRPAAPPVQAAASETLAVGEAPVAADWLVVAEPFASIGGAASDAAEQELLLDNMLQAIRVSRRAPGREGRACHLPVEEGQVDDLAAAIEAVRPRCILALGRVAATALLGGDEPLGKLRERVHERGGIPVVVSFALPYLLRHPADKARAWADLCRAVAAIG
jgi:uracil-DNA glycosylase